MQPIRGHDLIADTLNQSRQGPHALAAPINEGGAGNVGPHPGEGFSLPVKRKVVILFQDKNVGQKTRPRHAARNRA